MLKLHALLVLLKRHVSGKGISEALDITWRPRVLALQQGIDLFLRHAPALDGSLVRALAGVRAGAGGSELGVLEVDGAFPGLDGVEAGESVQHVA